MLDFALWLGFQFQVQLTGWCQFCTGLNLDTEILWSMLPGYSLIRWVQDLTEEIAFTPEGAGKFLERSGVEPPHLPTPEAVATALRACLKAQVEPWE